VTDLVFLRAIPVLVLGAVAYFYRPFQLDPFPAAITGLSLGGAALFLESRLRRLAGTQLLGGAIGACVGTGLALLASFVLSQASPDRASTVPFLQIAMLVLGAFLGSTLGGHIGFSRVGGTSLPTLTPSKLSARSDASKMNILDTSVIIDGRIADIAETGFIGGGVAIPQFVLRELQTVADSADSLKRNRGRRGLDVLQRLQKMPQLKVEILDHDFPHIREVDMKLVELGRLFGSKIVTNDFNLNKVAQLHGVTVLNINELTNALRPVVLPGEIMRVFVQKEGKEYNQGVAYLDDGTMVVVDNARRLISKTVDISVTSVLQTTAGKMIFGRFDDRVHAIYEKPNGEPVKPQRETSAAAPQA
jgi:uncharacterized protein YacL